LNFSEGITANSADTSALRATFTFAGGTVHDDVMITDGGTTVFVPGSSCHGGCPVRGPPLASSTTHQWTIRVTKVDHS
jgi:hypothetical protein